MVRRPLRRKSLKQHLGFERLPLQSEGPLRVQCGLLRVPSCSVSMSLCFSPLPLTPSNSFRRYFRSILPCCCCPRTSVPIRPKDGFGIPTRLNPGTTRVSHPFLPCSWIPRIPGSPRIPEQGCSVTTEANKHSYKPSASSPPAAVACSSAAAFFRVLSSSTFFSRK
jgi:hypothetical protein